MPKNTKAALIAKAPAFRSSSEADGSARVKRMAAAPNDTVPKSAKLSLMSGARRLSQFNTLSAP